MYTGKFAQFPSHGRYKRSVLTKKFEILITHFKALLEDTLIITKIKSTHKIDPLLRFSCHSKRLKQPSHIITCQIDPTLVACTPLNRQPACNF